MDGNPTTQARQVPLSLDANETPVPMYLHWAR